MAGGDEADEEIEAFARFAREALTIADPPPVDVSELAKIAFQFRDVETAQFDGALAGVRSDASGVTMQASKGPTTVIWSLDTRFLSGVVHSSADVSLLLQTPEATTTLATASDGSFEVAAPAKAYRLLVDEDENGRWATPWSMS